MGLRKIFLALMLAVSAQVLANDSIQIKSKPNVIIILTDDQGYGDLSVLGNPILKTPNLDRLHGQSVRFTDFHASSICTPTRGQLLTGMDACRNGAFAWAYSREVIHPEVPLISEVFKANGYATGHFGKWHLGDNYPYRPMDRGFDQSIKHAGGSVYQTPDYWNNDNVDDYYEHNGVMKQYKGYCTDVWFDETKKFILDSKNSKKPFFVYLPTNAPHSPFIVEEKYSEPYYDKLEKGFEPIPQFGRGMERNRSTAQFFGMIANIDENVGKLDQFLREEGLFENTILIFMTDNGGNAGCHVYNAGMRGTKKSLYDGGHRVPFFIRWPEGNLGNPRDLDVLTHIQDVFPTLTEMCGLDYTNDQLDGTSLQPLITETEVTLPGRMLVMQNARSPMVTKYDATVMWGKWRLIKNKELYDIGVDPGQITDISEERPAVISAMQAYYESWWEGIQKSVHRIPSFPVGGEATKKVVLTCFDWNDYEPQVNVTGQHIIRRGSGVKGHWNIEILEDGMYEVRIARWPEEAKTSITNGVPVHQTLTMSYLEGKALPIAYAKIEVGGEVRKTKVRPQDQYVSIALKLKKGKIQLSSGFYSKKDELICGGYYAYILKKS